MVRRYAASIIANPGSVGLAFRSWWPRPVRISPWAEYGVLTGEDGRLSIDLRRTPFDVAAPSAAETCYTRDLRSRLVVIRSTGIAICPTLSAVPILATARLRTSSASRS